MNTLNDTQQDIGPIKLAPGVTPKQIGVFLIVISAAICVLTFMPLMQPFVFTELFHIPREEQGRLAGNLATVQQIALLIFIVIWGGVADSQGRKIIVVIALLGYSACLFIYPLATAMSILFLVQFGFGMSWAAHTAGAATMMVDYPDNASRGKFTGLMIFVQGLTGIVLVALVGSHIPGWLVGLGFAPDLAGRYAFWAIAAIGLIGAGVAIFYLENVPILNAPAQKKRSLAEAASAFKEDYKAVVRYARQKPRFALVVVMGFVIRSDYVVMASFLSLWIMNGAAGQGVTSVDSLERAGILLAVFKCATLISPVICGLIADRVNRTVLLVASAALTGFTLISTILITNVMGFGITIVVAAIGISESALIIAGQSVLGDEAPPHIRGAAMGVYTAVGSISAVLIGFAGGYMFDLIGHTAPFVVVGSLNLVFAALGLFLLLRHHKVTQLE